MPAKTHNQHIQSQKFNCCQQLSVTVFLTRLYTERQNQEIVSRPQNDTDRRQYG